MAARRERVVEARELTRTFAGGGGIEDLELSVPQGVIFGIVGPSGSGKTTFVRLLLGLDVPDDGFLEVLGLDPGDFATAHRNRIGYLPQTTALYPDLSIRHNLHLVASLYGLPWRSRFVPGKRSRAARRRVEDTLEFVGLSDNTRTKLRDASGGEGRRLGLAAALIHDPDLIVLDEPTAGVDPLLRRDIWERLAALRDEGRTIVVTTQYVDEATHCDLVAVLAEGRTVAVDSPDGLRRLAFGDHPPDEATFDDVFVKVLQRHRAGGASRA